jgi:3-hydroxyacyl-CoA dehydrogenase
VDIVKADFQGLVIGGDGSNFSVGANLGFFLFAANTASWGMLSDVIKQGQNAVMGLKYAPFPVVGALHGMALGGGCETILHCDAVQAHVESYPGLVEVGVGVIPGWGGCKEMLWRHLTPDEGASGAGGGGIANFAAKMVGGGSMPAVKQVFETIALAKVAESAELARDLKILNAKSRISMNRDRLLEDAKGLCLDLARDYAAPEQTTIKLPGKSGRVALDMAVKGLEAMGKVTPHDKVVVGHLAQVLTGGDYDATEELSEQQLLDLEHEHFMQLVKLKPTLDRIEYMLENNKPLRN